MNFMVFSRSLFVFLLVSFCVCSAYAFDYVQNDSSLFFKYLNLASDQEFDLDERHLFSEKALEIAKRSNNTDAIMEAISKLGYIQAQKGQYAKAYDIFQSLIAMSDSVGYHTKVDYRRKAYLSNVFGLLHKELGEYDKAISYYFNSLSICDSINWIEGKASALTNIGVLYNISGSNLQAIKTLKMAAEISIANKIRNVQFDVFINLLDIYSQMNEFDSATIYANKVLDISYSNNSLYDQAFINNAFGNLYLQQEKFDKAVESFKASIKLSQDNGFAETLFEGLLSLAKSYIQLGDLIKADSVISSISNISGFSQMPVSVSRTLAVKSQLESHYGNYHKAYDLFKRSVDIRDSVDNSWEKVKYSEISAVYDMNLQKQKNLVLEQDVALKQYKIDQQKFIVYFSVLIAFSLAIVLFLIIRKRRFEHKTNELLLSRNRKITEQEQEIRINNEQKLKLELDSKNRQLTTFSLQTLKQSQSFDQVNEKIIELLNRDTINPETRKNLEHIIQLLHPVNSQNEWEEFKTYFEEVHPSFYANLKKLTPELTLHEQKICAYLRLGMTTKEIALITYRQVRSVESTRFRIRKKIGLTADKNLFDVLERL